MLGRRRPPAVSGSLSTVMRRTGRLRSWLPSALHDAGYCAQGARAAAKPATSRRRSASGSRVPKSAASDQSAATPHVVALRRVDGVRAVSMAAPIVRSRAPMALISGPVEEGTAPLASVRPRGLASHLGRAMMAALQAEVAAPGMRPTWWCGFPSV